MANQIPEELRDLMNMFLKLFQKYSALLKEPINLGDGELIYGREMVTIVTIGLNPKITSKKLTEQMGITKGAVSQVLSRLVKKQYIARFKDPKNSKFINLRLSDKGLLAFNVIMKRREEALNNYVQLYNNADEKELFVVRNLIESVEIDLDKILGIV